MSLELEVGYNGGFDSALNELKKFCEDEMKRIKTEYPNSSSAALRVLQMQLVIVKIDEMHKENRY